MNDTISLYDDQIFSGLTLLYQTFSPMVRPQGLLWGAHRFGCQIETHPLFRPMSAPGVICILQRPVRVLALEVRKGNALMTAVLIRDPPKCDLWLTKATLSLISRVGILFQLWVWPPRLGLCLSVRSRPGPPDNIALVQGRFMYSGYLGRHDAGSVPEATGRQWLSKNKHERGVFWKP